jgi:hypothetical protein
MSVGMARQRADGTACSGAHAAPAATVYHRGMRWAFLLAMVIGCASGSVAGVDSGSDVDRPDLEIDGPRPLDAAIDGVPCARQPCDLYAQCGCAAPASACDLDPNMFATGGTSCRTESTGGEATVCTTQLTCAAGHSCVGGRCRTFCDDEGDCPGPGSLCILSVNAGGMTIPGVTMCTTDCVPTQAQNATCPTGWACHVYFDAAGSRYLTDCTTAPATGGGAGAACTTSESCAAGLDCITLNPGGQQCRPTCVCPGGNCAAGTCTAGTGSCRGFTTPVVIGGTTYGACF